MKIKKIKNPLGTCLVAEKLRKRTELVHAPPPLGRHTKRIPHIGWSQRKQKHGGGLKSSSQERVETRQGRGAFTILWVENGVQLYTAPDRQGCPSWHLETYIYERNITTAYRLYRLVDKVLIFLGLSQFRKIPRMKGESG